MILEPDNHRDPLKSELVILVHGLSANRLVMWPLAYRLARAGFRTLNWGYPSTRRSCHYHAQQLEQIAREKSSDETLSRIHFIGHSMGCIVTRAALEISRPRQMGRVVMLAPPNGGSFVANRVGPLVRRICPTMVELSESPDSFVNRLQKPQGYEFGVIAAKFDWMIHPEKTRLPGEKDFSVIAANHGLLPWHGQTFDQSVRFLQTGYFRESAEGT